MTNIINYPSLRASCAESPEIMVYGYRDCAYRIIYETLATPKPFGDGLADSPIKNVFQYIIGDPTTPSLTLEGVPIYKIKTSGSPQSSFKAGLVNIVIENVKRQREARPLIPVLFTIDISTDKSGHYPPSVFDLINLRDRFHTLKELMRTYKLCTDPSLPSEVREVAAKTFIFVKVLVSQMDTRSPYGLPAETTTTYAFETLKAPWLQESKEVWDATFAEYREKIKTSRSAEQKEEHIREKRLKGLNWRPQLLEALGAPAFSASKA